MFYVISCWLGGMFINFKMMCICIDCFNEFDDLFEFECINDCFKVECIQFVSECECLLCFVGGICKMNCLFDVIFVVDFIKEVIVVQEVNKFGIFVIVLVDIDFDLDVIDYIVFGNDDVICSIQFIIYCVGDLLVEVCGGYEDVSVGFVEEQSDEVQVVEQGIEGDIVQFISSQGCS